MSSYLQIIVEDIFKIRNTNVLVIDEAQHIFQSLSERGAYREMEFIKSFSETTGIKIVLSGTYNLLKCTKLSAQLSRRLRIINVPRYDFTKENHVRYFKSVLNEFLRHYPVRYETGFHNDVKFFYTYSCGCIGVLKDLLTNALLKSSSVGLKVGYEELKAVVLHADGLKRIVQEISVGEDYFNNSDLDEIEKFLGLHSGKINFNKHANVKRNQTLPGKRKPRRDQV